MTKEEALAKLRGEYGDVTSAEGEAATSTGQDKQFPKTPPPKKGIELDIDALLA